MNRIARRVLLSIVMTAFLISLFSVETRAEKRIGVLRFSEEARYNEAQKGIMDQLKESGFGGPAVSFIIESAGGSKAKAAELVQKFAARRMDMIITLGTSATIAVAKEFTDVPIVFAMVFNPVEAKIAGDWKSSGNNTTGASPRVPMVKLVQTLKDFAPIKRLAVLYTPGEKNSEEQLKELQKLQSHFQIRVIPVILTEREEVGRTLSEVARTTDAMYLTGSNIVGAAAREIVAEANKAKVITLSHLDDLVEKGALLGVCASSYRVGRLAGKKAVRILRGAKPSSIPIETLNKFDVIVNMKTAKDGGFQIPPAFMKKITKTVD